MLLVNGGGGCIFYKNEDARRCIAQALGIVHGWKYVSSKIKHGYRGFILLHSDLYRCTLIRNQGSCFMNHLTVMIVNLGETAHCVEHGICDRDTKKPHTRTNGYGVGVMLRLRTPRSWIAPLWPWLALCD